MTKSLASLLGTGDGPHQLGKSTGADECPYCGRAFKRHAAGDFFLYAPHDDCCDTRAAVQAATFARHAHDPRLPEEERAEHLAFIDRMLEVTRRLNPAKRPTVMSLYDRAFSESALTMLGPVRCSENLRRLLVEHAWVPEGVPA